MIDFIRHLYPIQAIIGTSFTWITTALGATTVLVSKVVNRKILDWMYGFAGGIMIAAIYWSLIGPAIEMSKGENFLARLPSVAGFIGGGILLWGIDRILRRLHIKEEGDNTKKDYNDYFSHNSGKYSRGTFDWNSLWGSRRWFTFRFSPYSPCIGDECGGFKIFRKALRSL